MRRSVQLGAFVTSLALLTQVAAAQSRSPEVDASDAFQLGQTAYDAGRLSDALHAFETAYTLTRKPRALLRVADTADELGLHARAVSAFQEYLSLEPDAEDRPFILGRIRANQAAQGLLPQPAPVVLQPHAASAPVASAPTGATSGSHAGESAAGPAWLWAGAGVLALTAIIVAGVLVGTSSGSSTPTPVHGNVGGTIQTLGAP